MPGTRAKQRGSRKGDLPAASLAHELKTPVSACDAAVDSLKARLPQLMEIVMQAGEDPQWAAVLSFAARNMATPAPGPLLGLEGQRRAEALAASLREAGAGERAESAAAIFARFGWDAHLEEIGPALGSARGDEVLTLLDAAGRIRSSLWSLRNSLEKISEIMSRTSGSRAPAGETPGVADLRECAESALELLEHATPPEVGVELTVTGHPFARADAVRVEQILTNLVGNALDAVSRRGGRVRISCFSDEGWAAATVEDDGPGIDEALQEGLFTAYATSKEPGKGAGLGLYISRKLAVEMGGSLEFTSEPGSTRFRLKLPAAVSPAAPQGRAS